MRILNIEDTFFVPHFRRLGHEVLSIGTRSDCDVRLKKSLGPREFVAVLDARGFRPDLTLWVDGCRPPSVLGFELLPCVTMGYSIDQYCNPWHVPWSVCFDHLLVAQKDYMSLFSAATHPARGIEWFPLFFRPAGTASEPRERDIPLSFVGTVDGSINSRRKTFLNTVRSRFPLLVRRGDYQPIYERSQMVLNQSAAGEINFRLFEGAGCGALVVTERAGNGLDELLDPDEEMALYERGNAWDAVQVCRDLMADPDRLQSMARAGQRRVLRDHSTGTRVRHILKVAEKLIEDRAWRWRMGHQDVVRRELGKTFVMLGADRLLPLTDEMAWGYVRLGASWMGNTHVA